MPPKFRAVRRRCNKADVGIRNPLFVHFPLQGRCTLGGSHGDPAFSGGFAFTFAKLAQVENSFSMQGALGRIEEVNGENALQRAFKYLAHFVNLQQV